ncbi:replication initiation protein [Limibacter armeniacum]|uniref:replication initiation protein n=1 Tax=Limibacter armeniacum TaxID=466084 RepID=UPI002FE69C77
MKSDNNKTIEVDIENRVVKKSNRLVNAQDTRPMTAIERKLILFSITEAKSENKGRYHSEFTVQEFFGRKNIGKQQYDSIRKAAETLMQTQIRMDVGDVDSGNHKMDLINLFERFKADQQSGKVRVEFTQTISQHIQKVKSNYTTYLYHNVSKLRSDFAIRIYELLSQGLGKYPHRDFSLDELKGKLGIMGVTSYENFANLKRRVLEPACKEITEKSDIEASWKVLKKSGRKVTHVRFFMKDMKTEAGKVETDIPMELSEQLMKQIAGMRDLGLSEEQIRAATGLEILPDNQGSTSSEETPKPKQPKDGQLSLAMQPNTGNRTIQQKQKRLLDILQEYGLTKKQATFVLQKVGISKESGIWPLLNDFKMGVKDGSIKVPKSYLLKLLNEKYGLSLL